MMLLMMMMMMMMMIFFTMMMIVTTRTQPMLISGDYNNRVHDRIIYRARGGFRKCQGELLIKSKLFN